MIQRIQTVYWALAIVGAIASLFAPLATFAGLETITLFGTGFNSDVEVDMLFSPWAWSALQIVAAIILLGCIAMFNNRQLQMRVSRLATLIFFLNVVVGFVLVNNAASGLAEAGYEVQLQHGFGLILPLISVVLTMMGSRAVKKDEDLIRSADRLR